MKIIHLSDLHFQKNDDYERIKKALLQDISSKEINDENCLVAITGDIFNRGDTTLEKIEDLKSFFKEIKNVLPRSKFVFCPGNHDVNLKKIKPSVGKALSFMRASSDYSDVIFDEDYSIHFSDYISVCREVNREHYSLNNFVHHEKMSFGNISVGVISFNSSWLTNGGGVKDYGNLVLTQEQIDFGVKQISDCDFKIALIHHTFEWFVEKDKRYFEVLMLRDFDILLNGHNHNNITYNYNTNYGNLFVSNTASLSFDKHSYSSYNLLSVDFLKNTLNVQAREYYTNRNVFDVSTRFSPAGEFVVNFSNMCEDQLKIDFAKLMDQTNRHNEVLLSYSSSAIAPKCISKIFVEPPIYDKSAVEIDALDGRNNLNNIEKFDLKKISNRQSNTVFIGKKESGRTTLLNHIAINCRLDFSRASLLGFVIDFQSCKAKENSILEECTKFYENEVRKSDVKNLLEQGRVLVCIDNFDKDNLEVTDEFIKFFQKYNQCKFIIGALEDEISTVQRKYFEDIGFDVFYIHQYTKDHTLKLAANWFGKNLQDIPDKANALERLLVSLKIPRTPFITSVLLWVIENSANKALIINYASAVELLIDGLLEKIKNSGSRSEVDIHDQKYFLTLLAKYIHDKSVYKIGLLDFEQFAIDFFKSRLLSTSPSSFTKVFFDKGILILGGGEVFFKFDCFRAYFLGANFEHDHDFLINSLKFENIRKYSAELDFYTGVNKAKLEILFSVNEVSQTILKKVENSNNVSLLSNLSKLGNVPDSNIEDIEASFADDESYDDRLDSEQVAITNQISEKRINSDVRERQEILFKPFVEFISYAKVISAVVRNLELVNDPELKRNSFESILKIWSIIFNESFLLAEESNKILAEVASDGELEIIKSFTITLIPQSVIIMMGECLANPKMDVVYNNYINSESGFSEKLISVLLTAEAGSNNWINNINHIIDLADDYNARKMLGQVLFFRLISLLMTKVMSKKEQESVKEIAANLFILVNGLTKESKQRVTLVKQKFKVDLDRRMLNYLNM